MVEPAMIKKGKKRKQSPLKKLESLRAVLERQFRRIERSLAAHISGKVRVNHTRALDLIVRSNLDPNVSVSAAKLAIQNGLFTTNTLLQIITDGANPQVSCLCAKQLIENSRTPSFRFSSLAGERDALYQAMLLCQDHLTPGELRTIISDGAPKAKALAELALSIRVRIAAELDEESESL
ncbi:MAG: hypothetical protein ACP5N9_02600 [Candidatus Bilamarchaeum sp.]|jgi:hypothetical protein